MTIKNERFCVNHLKNFIPFDWIVNRIAGVSLLFSFAKLELQTAKEQTAKNNVVELLNISSIIIKKKKKKKNDEDIGLICSIDANKKKKTKPVNAVVNCVNGFNLFILRQFFLLLLFHIMSTGSLTIECPYAN